MKKILILLFLIPASLACFSQRHKKNSPPPPPVFKLLTTEDSLAYALGVLNYQSLNEELIKKYKLNIELDVLTRGMIDLSKDTSILNPKQSNEFLGRYMSKKEGQLSKTSNEEGKKFLADNRTKPGVIVTPSGLQYEVLLMGTGKKPLPTDRVNVHYHGTLIDGTVFDSSVQRNEPATFPLNRVIPGWTEGVQLMKPGAKFIFYIPSNLAYGDRDSGAIAPGSTLIFEVELFEINPKTDKK